MAFINSILSIFTQKRLAQIDFFKANPIKVQRDTLQELLTLAANTEYFALARRDQMVRQIVGDYRCQK